MEDELLGSGVYAIINKNLKMVYVGETQRNFLIRWTEHLMRIREYEDDPFKIHLYLNKNTKFIILKTLDSTNSRKDYYRLECEAMNFYENNGWAVLSTHTYNANSDYKEFEKETFDSLLERYRKCIKAMSFVLATVNSIHTNASYILKTSIRRLRKCSM